MHLLKLPSDGIWVFLMPLLITIKNRWESWYTNSPPVATGICQPRACSTSVRVSQNRWGTISPVSMRPLSRLSLQTKKYLWRNSIKLVLMLAEVVIREECYIKCEESNAEKKAYSVKERILDAESSHPLRKNRYTSHVKYKSMFKGVGKATKCFTPIENRYGVRNSTCTTSWHHLPLGPRWWDMSLESGVSSIR